MINILSPKLDTLIVIAVICLVIFLIISFRKSTANTNENSTRLGIQELVEKVRTELVEIGERRIETNKPALLELKDFELEINFVIKESNSVKEGFELKAVTLGSETEFSSEKIQKIKLRMAAVPPQTEESAAEGESGEILNTPPESEKPLRRK